METTTILVLYRCYMGIMENEMELLQYWGYVGLI